MIILQLDSEQLNTLIQSAVRTALTEKALTTLQPPTENDWLNADEAAALINLAKATLYGLVHRQEIPHYKKGKKLMFSRAELTHWLKAGKQKTTADFAAEAKTLIDDRKKRRG